MTPTFLGARGGRAPCDAWCAPQHEAEARTFRAVALPFYAWSYAQQAASRLGDVSGYPNSIVPTKEDATEQARRVCAQIRAHVLLPRLEALELVDLLGAI